MLGYMDLPYEEWKTSSKPEQYEVISSRWTASDFQIKITLTGNMIETKTTFLIL